jgi:uncharacterized integral membrane protein (TIGR00698 family)
MTMAARRARLSLWPGLVLSCVVAAVAFGLRQLPDIGIFSPMIIAVILGMACHNLFGTPATARAGVKFSARQVLRFAVALLGLQLTIAQVAEIGWIGIVIIVTVLAANFLFTKWLGRLLDVDAKLAELIAAGTSICGASAVVATNTVTGGTDEDVAYAVACVTIFGSVAMFAFPLLAGPFELDPRAYGLWAGSSIHEIAQVVAAAFQGGSEAGHIATIAKLSRVAMLAPLVVALGLVGRRTTKGNPPNGRKASPVPWFVVAFVALVIIASIFPIPPQPLSWLALATSFLLSMALAALGLETDIRKLLAKGISPFLLGGASAVFIASLSLILLKGAQSG